MSWYVKKYVAWQRRRLGQWKRYLLIFTFPIIFIVGFVTAPGYWAYRRLHWPMGLETPFNLLICGPLLLFGMGLYCWTIILFARARGTQVPMAPTQELVVTGPYAITRNPMVTGAIFMVLGLACFFNSLAFLGIGMIIPVHYLIYVKFFEERELEARFGEAYKKYKQNTPFILPKIIKGKKA